MSETNHVESFKCPHCGAPIEYDGQGAKTVTCPFCAQPALVPENLLPRPAAAPFMSSGMDQGALIGQAVELAMIVKALRAGNKIEAIKIYRQATGASLLDAKTAVEQIEQGNFSQVSFSTDSAAFTETTPAPVAAKSGRGGAIALSFLVLFLVVVGAAVFILSQTGAFNSAQRSPTIDVAAEQRSAKATILAQVATPTAVPTRAPTPTPPYASALLTFGSEGIGPGKFTNAARIGVDGKGNVYVGEYDGGRVQVFDAAGKFVSQFAPAETHYKLDGFAVARDGTVYMDDDATITRYNGLTGQKLGSLAYSGGPGFGELAVAPDGGLAAMWYPHRNGARESPENLVRFDPQGKVTQVISQPVSSQTGEYEYQNVPIFDGRGSLFVLSHVSSAIFAFSPDGKFVNRFGSAGKAPDQIDLPNSIAIDSQGLIYVADGRGVAIYSPQGRFVRRFQMDKGVRTMVFDDNDALWVLQNATVTKYALGQ